MKHCSIPDVWTGEEALAFVAFLERLSEAIWRAHGQEMERCLRLHHDAVTLACDPTAASDDSPYPSSHWR